MNALPLRALMVALVLASAPAVAQEEKIDPAVLTEGFLAAHPDLRWRAEGVRSYERKDYDEALAAFRRAAFHGDKPAQAMIATISTPQPAISWLGLPSLSARTPPANTPTSAMR